MATPEHEVDVVVIGAGQAGLAAGYFLRRVARREDLDFVVLDAGGHVVAVEREDGMVDHLLFALSVNAKPADIPNELTVDISALTIGDAIRVGDLALPSGVTTDVEAEEVIAIATK